MALVDDSVAGLVTLLQTDLVLALTFISEQVDQCDTQREYIGLGEVDPSSLRGKVVQEFWCVVVAISFVELSARLLVI